MKRLVLLAVILGLPGCAQSIRPATRTFNTLTPGIVQTKQVGEALYEKGAIEVVPGFRARRDCNPPLIEHLLYPPVRGGDVFVCDLLLGNGDYACSNPDLKQEAVQTDSKAPGVAEVPRFIINKLGEFRGLKFGDGRVLESTDVLNRLFEATEVPTGSTRRQQLVYNGKNDEIIRLTYQEFTGDTAKPSLFQGLTYNIASLNVIQVQDVFIEIIEATDASISYIVKNEKSP